MMDKGGRDEKGASDMAIRFEKISKQPRVFNRIFGVSVEQAQSIRGGVRPFWEEKIKGSYKRPGRNAKLELADQVLMLLLYYRSYVTMVFVGHLFGIDDSNVCRIIKRLEPLVAKVTAITKDRTYRDLDLELIIDATEQPIERPRKRQKRYYSGKKKRHTLKTEIRINGKGEIKHVSKSRPGSIHDFELHKKEPPVPRDARVYVDSGYQGLDKRHRDTELPYKRKKKKLEKEERDYNRTLSSFRVKVENILAQIKLFKIIGERYRNKRRGYGVKMNIIAGIVNMKNGFSAA